jgi:TonB-linked SusC/RagA family outer membrane protein
MKQKSQMKQGTSGKCGYAKYLRLPLMIMLLSLLCGQVLAQSILLKGVVKDSKGEPIIGASVYPKGQTAKGTITDFNGNFALKVVKNETIVVSYVGFRSQEFIAKAGGINNIVLQEDSRVLDDVVVVAYGTQKKVSVTGAISTANTKDLRKSAAPSFDNSLAGRITGLISTQSNGGQPGSDSGTLMLRGVSTLNGSSPLILVDGVTYNNVSGNIISEIDPNEVESVSVLKDASATAVFGVRGANGVILITTRHGKSGKTHMSVSLQQSFTSFCRKDPRLHSWDFMRIRNEALANDGKNPEYSDDVIEKFKNPLWGLDPSDENYEKTAAARQYLYCDHYYMDELFRKYTPQTKADVNLSGGSDRFQYFMNVGYVHQGGNLKTQSKDELGYDPAAKMDRWNFRSNFDYQITKSLKSQLNIGTCIQTINTPATGDISDSDTSGLITDLFYNAQIMLPCQAGPVTLDGYGVPAGMTIKPTNMDANPYEEMNRRGYRKNTQVDLSVQLALEWDLSKLVTQGLSLRGQVSYNGSGATRREGSKTEADYYVIPDYDKGTFVYSLHQATPTRLSLSRAYSSLYSINAQASLNYHRTFNKIHDVTGMILAQRDYWEYNSAAIPYNVLGICARATYAYDSRYLAEVNMGYNGSEQFSPSKRFGFFPAFSLGWIVSNESFMKDATWLDNLKLRYSNGKVGNDKIGSTRFLYQDNIRTSGTSYAGGLGSTSIRSISQGLLGNKDITWETAHKQNFGIDLGILKCLTMSLDYYTENRSDILISRQTIPSFQGVSLSNIPKVNMGKMKNHGFEIEATFDKNITKDWHLRLNGNYATNDNKITYSDEPNRTEDYACRMRTTGYRLNQCWGYKIDYSKNDGYYVSQDDIKQSGLTYSFGTPRPGDFRYIDVNGDATIDTKDKVPIEYSEIPGISYGFGLSTSYKGFDFSVLFQGLAHYSSHYSSLGVYENFQHGYYFNYHRTAWTEERWANHEKITYPALTTNSSSTSQEPNDFFIQNRGFLRLKNIELGYTLPKNVLKFAGISSCRIYVSGLNLYCWDHLDIDHLDPEQDCPYGYPVTKSVSLGLNVNF